DEFARAARSGLEAIERIYDVHGADMNPLATDTGIAAMRSAAAGSGVAVKSLCADYFLDRPLLRAGAAEREELLTILSWLIERCGMGAIRHIVLPFVDASRIETEADVDAVASMLPPALAVADRAGVELHLETALPPERFAGLLDRLPHRMLKANY